MIKACAVERERASGPKAVCVCCVIFAMFIASTAPTRGHFVADSTSSREGQKSKAVVRDRVVATRTPSRRPLLWSQPSKVSTSAQYPSPL